MKTKVLLLAGGFGTRLRPITNTTPKCLVPVGGRPLIDYWLDRFAEAGIRDVLINTHHLAGPVRDYINTINRNEDFNLEETYEPKLLGSAGTITNNASYADDADHILIVYADNLSDMPIAEFIDFHESNESPFTMMVFHTDKPKQCGIAATNADGLVTEFVEKPEHPKSDLANGGVYAVTQQTYRDIAVMNKFDMGFDVLPTYVGKMYAWPWTGYHRDIGNHDALDQANEDIGTTYTAKQREVG